MGILMVAISNMSDRFESAATSNQTKYFRFAEID